MDEFRARRRRERRQRRATPTRDGRWLLRVVGKVLVSAGILMFGFVAYQLWGTGIEYARAQGELEVELDALLPGDPVVASRPAEPQPATASPQPGDALMRLEVPAIGLDATVVEGVGRDELKRGPGHYPSTPLPGQLGNAAIAGHRTTYGAPFQQLDELEPGDDIIVTSAQGPHVYRVTARQIVEPSAREVLATTDPTTARLTLTTCHPEYSAESRLIVFAELDLSASTPATPPAEADGMPPTVGTGTTADGFVQGWFSDTAAFGQVALWGSALAVIGLGAYSVSRMTRRNVIGALAGGAPFIVAAYFFFQNLNRLLPAAL